MARPEDKRIEEESSGEKNDPEFDPEEEEGGEGEEPVSEGSELGQGEEEEEEEEEESTESGDSDGRESCSASGYASEGEGWEGEEVEAENGGLARKSTRVGGRLHNVEPRADPPLCINDARASRGPLAGLAADTHNRAPGRPTSSRHEARLVPGSGGASNKATGPATWHQPDDVSCEIVASRPWQKQRRPREEVDLTDSPAPAPSAAQARPRLPRVPSLPRPAMAPTHKTIDLSNLPSSPEESKGAPPAASPSAACWSPAWPNAKPAAAEAQNQRHAPPAAPALGRRGQRQTRLDAYAGFSRRGAGCGGAAPGPAPRPAAPVAMQTAAGPKPCSDTAAAVVCRRPLLPLASASWSAASGGQKPAGQRGGGAVSVLAELVMAEREAREHQSRFGGGDGTLLREQLRDGNPLLPVILRFPQEQGWTEWRHVNPHTFMKALKRDPESFEPGIYEFGLQLPDQPGEILSFYLGSAGGNCQVFRGPQDVALGCVPTEPSEKPCIYSRTQDYARKRTASRGGQPQPLIGPTKECEEKMALWKELLQRGEIYHRYRPTQADEDPTVVEAAILKAVDYPLNRLGKQVAKYRHLMVKDSDGVWKPITQARRYPVVKSSIEYPL